MKYQLLSRKIVTCLFSAALTAGMFSVQAADSDYEIGTWGNFCQGAISHTFDDNTSGQLSNGVPAFNAVGMHMTMFVVTNQISNWSGYVSAFEDGHEIASHNQNHDSNASGIQPSQNAIRQNVPGEMAATMAYPNCNTPGDQQVLQVYIAGRNCNGQVNSTSPSNWAQIGSKMFGSGQCNCPNDANSMNSFADQAASSNGWAVTCHHGIGNDNHSWAVTSLSAMEGHLEYLDQNRDKIWCETFGNVARYIKERDAADVVEKASDDKSFTVEVTDNLDDEIFNYPLTIRRPLPEGWEEENIVVTQGEDTVEAEVVENFIQFNAVPDGGDVLITNGSTAARHGMRNRCMQPAEIIGYMNNKLQISTEPFAGSNITVSIFNLSGKLLSRSTVHSVDGTSAIVDVGGTIGKTAFIVAASNGTVSHMKRLIP